MTDSTYGLDGSDRKAFEVGRLRFDLGPLPDGKAQVLLSAFDRSFSKLRKAIETDHPDYVKALTEAQVKGQPHPPAPESPAVQAAFEEQIEERVLAARELIRWGVKGWSSTFEQFAPKPPRFVQTSYAGKTYDVLCDEQVSALVKRGLAIPLASKIKEAEEMGAREALGF